MHTHAHYTYKQSHDFSVSSSKLIALTDEILLVICYRGRTMSVGSISKC